MNILQSQPKLPVQIPKSSFVLGPVTIKPNVAAISVLKHLQDRSKILVYMIKKTGFVPRSCFFNLSSGGLVIGVRVRLLVMSLCAVSLNKMIYLSYFSLHREVCTCEGEGRGVRTTATRCLGSVELVCEKRL